MKTLNKNTIQGLTAGELYTCVLFLSFFLIFLYFASALHIEYISLPFKLISAAADSLFFVMVCMFLKGKWKFAGVVIAFILSFLLLANLLYYRNFEDIIQASGYLNTTIADPTITEGASSSFRISDLSLMIIPFFPALFLICRRKAVYESNINSKWKIRIAVLFLLTWTISYAGVFRRKSFCSPDSTKKEIITSVFSKEIVTWRGVYEMHNFTGYLTQCVISSLNIGMRLSPADISNIKNHIKEASCRRGHPRLDEDSVSHAGKNLIMIIVESLPFKAVTLPEAERLTPCLHGLISDSTSIVSRCSVLSGYGRSSDAQFIYNTGLLPLRNEAFADNYAFNNYPSLAKALNYTSMEIIGESKGVWNHSLTTKSYGFGSLIENVAPKGMDQDSIIFQRSVKEIASIKKPFFLFISTISMHDPYEERRISDESTYLESIADDDRDREYYARLRHFDKSLGEFLSALRREGIYDDSVIVILGDHEIRASKISESLHDDYVPFIIINAPLEGSKGTVTTQLDVFPTILDVMGAEYLYLGVDYSGLGQSIFSNEAKSGKYYAPTDKDYVVSEMIIKGRPSEL